MSGPEVKKRHAQVVYNGTVEAPTTQPTTKARTRDNKYIFSGFRPEKADYLEILTSLTSLHNETCNVYTHLVGALLLPLIATAFMRVLSEPQFLNVSGIDFFMFRIFFWSAECCLILSTAFHLLGSHSQGAEQFWHRMDLMGIVIAILGTFIPGIFYIFTCEPGLQKLHSAIVGSFVALGASAFIPLLHGVQLYGLEYMLQYSGMKWYLLEIVSYGVGVGLYGFRIPERLAPGKFDIWGSSHQIFHIAILCGMYLHAVALTQAFTAYHTLDICNIKAAHRAS
ncbi:hemolysin-III protein [Hypoxylon rubiginosum]|uniref:Hemolysin-III protein n=1 Tax=Hypoxylon rubiginosum TaxID=110542 RepID=A0ACB9YYA1_9PEZI|nr:hemolysin-III protein [Hypoxylon rubiginosum]